MTSFATGPVSSLLPRRKKLSTEPRLDPPLEFPVWLTEQPRQHRSATCSCKRTSNIPSPLVDSVLSKNFASDGRPATHLIRILFSTEAKSGNPHAYCPLLQYRAIACARGNCFRLPSCAVVRSDGTVQIVLQQECGRLNQDPVPVCLRCL